MNDITFAVTLALALAALLLWLLRPQRHTEKESRLPAGERMDSILPKHYRFFPQIRQALSERDGQYLREVAPAPIAQQVIRERREVARKFLRGLHEDFSNLERLARIVASLSPEISREQETERLLLGLKFRLLYVLVQLRLSTGRVPVAEIERLTELIGRFALRMEQAMAEIAALSASQVPGRLSA